MAGLSLSAFARKMCLGTPIETQMDSLARIELSHLRGDLGKLGGLLKQALANGIEKREIYGRLKELDTVNLKIRSVLEKITPQ